MRHYLNWKFFLAILALLMVIASVLYTNQLASELSQQEYLKVEQQVKALELLNQTTDPNTIEYTSRIIEENKTIPLILTDEQDQIVSTSNLDSSQLRKNKRYFLNQLEDFKNANKPIILDFGFGVQKVYYGDSHLLKQLRYFPYVQLVIIVLFLTVVLIALSAAHRSLQNQVWVGLSKETAHQLGTPLSSIEGWLELLQDSEEHGEAVSEMRKDLARLKLVADRFGKVGSAPNLEMEDVNSRLRDMVVYMQKRAPSKISICLETIEDEIPVLLSGPLFDWVVENLIRNALDAMDGKGEIRLKVRNGTDKIRIDVCDTGKGIPRHQVKKIFNPGFTTKKRGWGLGLSLSKRIIEKYHHGSLFVLQSEPGRGTTFRIILRR